MNPTKSLLDTDMLSEILKAINPFVVARADAYYNDFGIYTTSEITVMEVVKGFHKLLNEPRISQFLKVVESFEVLPPDRDTFILAGRIYADLERTGQIIGREDPLIAAIALQHGLTLVTGNTAHYQRIQALGYNLQLDNWRV